MNGQSPRFDWSKRTNQPIVTLPFVEEPPTKLQAKQMSQWIRANADMYENKLVKMYHATCPSIDILKQGLKPTSMTRRRSFQSTSGYVYLANTPERAKTFGELGNQGRAVVYEVVVLVRRLCADLDQLGNQRSVGQEIGNSIGESIVFGGGARIKGAIQPWAIRQMDAHELKFSERTPSMSKEDLPDPVFARSDAIKKEYLESGCQASDVDDAVAKLMQECPDLFEDDRAAWSFLMEETHEEREAA